MSENSEKIVNTGLKEMYSDYNKVLSVFYKASLQEQEVYGQLLLAIDTKIKDAINTRDGKNINIKDTVIRTDGAFDNKVSDVKIIEHIENLYPEMIGASVSLEKTIKSRVVNNKQLQQPIDSKKNETNELPFNPKNIEENGEER